MGSVAVAAKRYVEASPDGVFVRQRSVYQRVNVVGQLGVDVEEKQGVARGDARARILLRCASAWGGDGVIAMRARKKKCVVATAAINHDNFRATRA